MNKKDIVHNSQVAAYWINELKQTVTFVSQKKKISNRNGWYYRYTWNIQGCNGEWRPLELSDLYLALGITKYTDGSCDLGEVLKRNGFPVKDDGMIVTVFGDDVTSIIAKSSRMAQ